MTPRPVSCSGVGTASEDLLLRPERASDIPAIRIVNEAAFGQPGEADLVDALRRSGAATLSLAALIRGILVGHILFSPVTLGGAVSESRLVGLGPMAVLPRFQRKGVGSALVRAGLVRCREMGLAGVFVVGHPTYYPRFGFVAASRLGLKCEFDVPEEIFMALELQPGVLSELGGVVRYRPEFRTL